MTNGEKLKEVFPNIQIFNVTENELREKFIYIRLGDVCQAIELEWWNAEYKEPNNSKIKWIPITYRTMDEEEKEYYKDTENHRLVLLNGLGILNCKLPEDNQEVLITTITGSVDTDIFCIDDNCCYFDSYDINDVIAWANFPAPYKRGQGQIKNDN